MNGLRESSVLSLLAEHVTCGPRLVTARLSVVKGRHASQVPFVSYHRWDDLLSPIDIWIRWTHARGNHVRVFALDGEGAALSVGAMTRYLHQCLSLAAAEPLPSDKFNSHSLRIGSHTEQVVLGIPMEVRLSRFDWGPRSDEMASLYFDRTVRVSSASFWVSCPGFPRAPQNQAITAASPSVAGPST